MITNPKQHTILVSGATGQQGGAIARHLLQKGFTVRALTRDADQDAARKLSQAGAEIAEGDFEDRASLDKAFRGVYGAFSVQNTWVVGVDGEIRQGKAFADAALDAGIEHFVYSSVSSADRDTGIPHFDSKWEIEKYIRSLELPATILRPVFFMENWFSLKEQILDGKLPQPLLPETTLQQIAVDDIGFFAALAFSDPETWLGEAMELAGDELSMTETAGVFSEAIGKKVQYMQVPWEAFKEQMGEEGNIMYRWFEKTGYEVDIDSLRQLHPGLKNLKTFLRTTAFS